MKNYMNNVKNIQDFVDQNENTKSEIQKCIKYLVRETNKQKLNYSQLRYIFRAVRERCDIEVTKDKKSLFKLPKACELEKFYNQINSPVHKLIFKFLEQTGLRVSEMCNLKIADINFDKNTIFVSQGKGKKDRVVPLGNRLKEKLQIYLNGKNNKYLFESIRNSKFSTRRIEQLCSKYSKDVDVKITPHTFRHIYFSLLAESKISKEHRMLIAGHSNQKTQDIYTHLTLGGIKEEIIAILDE